MNGKPLAHGNIKVTIKDDNIDVKSEAVPSMQSSPGFVLIKPLANIFFFKAGTKHTEKKNQVANFNNQVTLEVPIPPDVLNNPTVKQQGKDILKLAYFDKTKNKWVIFNNQSLDKKNNLGIVNFNQWIKDPPIGWGHPTT